MDEQEAQKIACEAAAKRNWGNVASVMPDPPNGCYIFSCDIFNVPPKKIVVVRKDNKKPFYLTSSFAARWLKDMEVVASGKCGSMLGLPTSEMRHLASQRGEYQLFDHGTILKNSWETKSIQLDISKLRRKTFASIIFFDLRGFTNWSEKSDATIQELLADIENIIQMELSILNPASMIRPFLKGTGDGMMLVLEEPWNTYPNGVHEYQPGYGDDFPVKILRLCAAINETVRKILPSELALGCGAEYGEITQVFILGESDFIGREANNAAKLQALAWNEIVVGPVFQKRIHYINPPLAAKGHLLGEKGVRYSPTDVLEFLTKSKSS